MLTTGYGRYFILIILYDSRRSLHVESRLSETDVNGDCSTYVVYNFSDMEETAIAQGSSNELQRGGITPLTSPISVRTSRCTYQNFTFIVQDNMMVTLDARYYTLSETDGTITIHLMAVERRNRRSSKPSVERRARWPSIRLS